MRIQLPLARAAGILIAFAGLVVLLCSLPGWIWLSVAGLALIAAGLYLFLGRRC